jgi:glycosyltransferase involved in cell wall biosynthesis
MSGGGSERQMLGVLKHLDRSRFSPELYLITPTGELLPEIPADVPVHSFQDRHQEPIGRLPGAGFRARTRDLARLLEERQIDVIYDRTWHMTLITAQAAALRPTPRVSVIVTDNRRDFEINTERFRWIKRRLMRKAYLTADRVLAVSEGARESAMKYHGLPPEKIQTFYNLFDVQHIDRQAAEALPASINKDDSRFVVVALGRLHAAKGYDVLVEAVRRAVYDLGHPQLELWILGEGELRSSLERQIREARLEQHVRLLGFQDNPHRFLKVADLFCLSSRYEGMPNALVEAMLSGTPVLSTDCQSGPREILQSGRLGRLVPVDNPKALADAIADAIVNRPAWKELTALARQHAESRYAMASGIRRLGEILEEVSGKPALDQSS